MRISIKTGVDGGHVWSRFAIRRQTRRSADIERTTRGMFSRVFIFERPYGGDVKASSVRM